MSLKNNQKGFGFIICIVILAFIYLMLFSFARSGWGYMGYRGYRSGPSWYYWGGPRYHYYDSSYRHGSRGGGRSHRGGGLRGGK